MTRFIALAGLVLAMSLPVSGSAETVLEQRLDTFGNRIEGLFTNDQVGHSIKSIEDQRTLNISLLRNHLNEIQALLRGLDQIEVDLTRLVDGYIPVDHRCVELGVCNIPAPLAQPGAIVPVMPIDNYGGVIAPAPITQCSLNSDGTIGVCEETR